MKETDVKVKETNKLICAVAYILFFVPLIVDSENNEYKFHSNQGLNLFILVVLVSVVGSIIPFIGWFVILPIGGLFCFVLFIIGVINAINEKTKDLPIIGKIKLIK